VILISGPTKLDTPERAEQISVRSTEEMHRAVLAHLSPATIVVMAAAVADYRPIAPRGEKIKRQADHLTIELEATPDILADVAGIRGDRILIGFAAETGNIAENARRKLASKSADLIVANDVTAQGAGFDVDTNIVTLYARDGREIPLPRMAKLDVAHRVLDQALELRRARQSSAARPAALNPQP
jgi:phosphopantothenoylcysteine decarboxylase/phosphopantothenate--cysteine ligase